MSKQCYGCHVQKPVGAFGPSTKSKDGRASRCRECLARYSRERRALIETGEWEATGFRQRNAEMRANGLRHCPKCRTYKPDDAFWKGTQDGRQAYCIDCMKAVRRNNPVPLREALARHTQVLRMAAFDAYGGRICACCGEANDRFLTIDHIGGGGIAHRRMIGGGKKLYAWMRKNGYPLGYQILCFNCNSGRQLNGGICPHLNLPSLLAHQLQQ